MVPPMRESAWANPMRGFMPESHWGKLMWSLDMALPTARAKPQAVNAVTGLLTRFSTYDLGHVRST
jgi:hypothetical protein